MRARQIPSRKRLVDVHSILAITMGASASSANRNTLLGFIGNEKQPKILVLGCMGSGKTTLCRQLVRFSRTHTPVLSYYTHAIQHHLLLIWKEVELLCQQYEIDASRCKDDFERLNEFRHKETLKGNIVDAMLRIANSGLYEECQLRTRYLPLPYNYSYFIHSSKRILDEKYEPTEQDVLNSYAPTIGISDYPIRVGFSRYHLVELPGHHIFRRRWHDFFKHTIALFFMIDLSELCDSEFYKGYLKGKTLQIFKDLLPSPVLRNAGLILLFNKKDRFQERAVTMNWSNLAQHVRSSSEALSFYRSQFVTLLPKGRSYHHIVNLVSVKNIGGAMVESLASILKHNKETTKPL